MKLHTALLAATLATFAASAPFAYADHHLDGKPEAAKETKNDAKKPANKHNHLEEKTHMPMSQPDAKEGDMKKMDGHEKMMKMRDHSKVAH